jgi:hypothetical protein
VTGTIVHRLHEDFTALTSTLSEAAEPSLCVTANDCFRKALLLAAASHFEASITNALLEYVGSVSARNPLIIEFVRRKGLNRQYHALFDWDKRNANSFFAHFGDEFKQFAEQRVRQDSALDESVRAFLELGRERNRLVHQDFGNFVLEKTADEIYATFLKAESFASGLPALLRECPLQAQAPNQALSE